MLLRTLKTLAVASVALLAACSGKTVSDLESPGDGGEDSASHGDASTSDGSVSDGSASDASHHGACPSSAPRVGDPCARNDLQCEYGGSMYPGCNRIVQCSSGTWQDGSFGGYCPNGANAPECPATMSDVKVGSTCNSQATASCHYPEGQCYCGFQFGPPPPPIDGGPPTTWTCDNPGPGCAIPRPMLGDACAKEGQQCMYLTCSFAESCSGGLWTASPIGCAGANGG